MKRLLSILLVLALSLSLSAASAEEETILGKPFPDFTVTDTDGNTFTLSEALKDHDAALINIWATWCPPCRAEMPYLNTVYEQYGDRVAFIALSCEKNDTPEAIEAFRRENGLTFPMGRDEGSTLFSYTGAQGVPTTVIVDRFGNAAFVHVGSFFSAGEISRTLESFLGNGYTETTVLTNIPKDSTTRMFPVSQATRARLVNENVRPLSFMVEGRDGKLPVYVVDGDARLAIEIEASVNPSDIICYDFSRTKYLPLADLPDSGEDAFVYVSPMPGPGETPYTYVGLVDGNGSLIATTYIVFGEEHIETFAEALRASGRKVSWEDAEPAPAEEAKTEPQAYVLHVVDQDGAPVAGMMINFCTDTACNMTQSDENGTITYDGQPDVYHIQLLKAPEGYSFDPEFEMYTEAAYGEWIVRIRKN